VPNIVRRLTAKDLKAALESVPDDADVVIEFGTTRDGDESKETGVATDTWYKAIGMEFRIEVQAEDR